MKKRWPCQIFICLFLVGVVAVPICHGQVITEDARAWAADALKKEKSLQTVEGDKTLAVLYFNNKTGQSGLDALQKGLTFMLITDLSTVNGLQVVERVRLQALTDEMKLGVSGLVDAGSVPRIGRLLGAQWLVGGDISGDEGERLYVESSLLDVSDTQILGQPSAEGLLANFFKVEKDLLFRIIALLNIELTPAERARLEKPLTTDVKALLDLFNAIQASDQENYEKAEAYYERAIKRDAGIAPAHEFLSELRSLGKISPVMKKNRQLLQTIRQETSLTDVHTTTETTRRENNPDEGNAPITIQVNVPQL